MKMDQAIRNVVAEIDACLSRLSGPGVRDVRAGINRWCQGAIKATVSHSNPIFADLDMALEAMRDTDSALAKAIADVSPHLNWVTCDFYPREEIGADFADGHAFASVIGEGCPLEATDFDLGLFVVKSNILYRDHHHAAPELYVPLTGPHGWRFKPGDPLIWKQAGEPVWNEPWQPHATMVGTVPFLAFYAWTRDISNPATVITSSDWSELETSRHP